MSNKTRKDLLEHVKATKKQLKESSVSDIETLDVEYTLDVNHNLKEITLTLTTGGPKIDVELNSYVIKGYWSGAIIDYPIFENEKKVRATIDDLWYQFKDIYNSYI